MAQPTPEEVERVINAYENAKTAVIYAGTLIIEMQQIEDEDYKMVWN